MINAHTEKKSRPTSGFYLAALITDLFFQIPPEKLIFFCPKLPLNDGPFWSCWQIVLLNPIVYLKMATRTLRINDFGHFFGRFFLCIGNSCKTR